MIPADEVRELLSPFGLGIALLLLCVAIGIWTALIMKKTAKEFGALPERPKRNSCH